MFRSLAVLLLAAAPLRAEMVVATRTIPAGSVLEAPDMALREGSATGAVAHPDEALGLEARVALYPGRPIRAADLGPPALIERNQLVTLVYRRSGLLIATEARALGRAGAGDIVKVMNLASRSTVTGQVDAAGRVIVGPSARLLHDLEDF
ncbi:flagellar basal body P-ring formation chaperone FlgA [Vannielia litorea]|uniref:Flagella basal body P-ring formation protein FlgA n=1 Tax=Vannielia litorea TaxID=1217970 RepID=A0A1N6IIU0_9RHOB|nr:flagellar basal body P-ring formation chaperone FlgA [Vannielia litorea]SIO31893.1 flagella basal body P-ring formation protein FlgA [Vannielia litorea]